MSLLCAAMSRMIRASLASRRVTSSSSCPCKAWSQVREFIGINRKGGTVFKGPLDPWCPEALHAAVE